MFRNVVARSPGSNVVEWAGLPFAPVRTVKQSDTFGPRSNAHKMLRSSVYMVLRFSKRRGGSASMLLPLLKCRVGNSTMGLQSGCGRLKLLQISILKVNSSIFLSSETMCGSCCIVVTSSRQAKQFRLLSCIALWEASEVELNSRS